MSLKDKVVLITGAKGGLGTHVTNVFLEAGARVAGSSRSIQASDFPHGSFEPMPVELSSAESARALVETVISRFGRIDAAVHLMGAFAGGASVAETDDATFESMLDLNFRSAIYLFRPVISRMRSQGGGNILAIGSRHAMEPRPAVGAYAVSKAALVTLVKTIAIENKDAGITANVILPGTIDTPANRSAMKDADYSKWVDPAEIARLLVQLASQESPQITGAVIPVYGRDL